MISSNKGKEMEFEGEGVVKEEMIYVAVSKDIKESKSLVSWALQNSGGKRICVIHVHQPADRIPTPLGYMPAISLREKEVRAFRDKEIREMSAILDEYHSISQKCGASIEKLYIEVDYIEKGIIQLIEEHNIQKLVIGAAANKHYSRKMEEIRSKKALYVRDNAPPFCHIFFICKGYLIHTRRATSTPSSSVAGERSIIMGGLNAPSYYADSVDGSDSRSGSAKWVDSVRSFASSPMYPQSISPSEFDKASRLESLYIEECIYRKEVEAELAKVKAELERMKNQVPGMPKKNEGLETTDELRKVIAELEYRKSNVLGELRMAMEQKELLQSQIGNFTFLLQRLGENLTSAIDVVQIHDQGRHTSFVYREPIGQNNFFRKHFVHILGYLLLTYICIQIFNTTLYKVNAIFF
ncbi:hypothetical protein vseg_009345 [Gypsophila vaccaria]